MRARDNIPAVASGDVRRIERCDEFGEPVVRESGIGIAEDEDVGRCAGLSHGIT